MTHPITDAVERLDLFRRTLASTKGAMVGALVEAYQPSGARSYEEARLMLGADLETVLVALTLAPA